MQNPPSGTRPTGTVTFLFTDIEQSTKRWETNPAAMQLAFSRQEAIVRHAIEADGGYAYNMVGDAFQAAFPSAPQAVQAAIDAQLLLFTEQWPPSIGELNVRMALHTGVIEERVDDYVGPALNRVARLLRAGHGGQVLLSAATQELVRDQLSQLQPTDPPGVQLLDLGEHRLKDLTRPEHIFQLVVPGLPTRFPPLRTLDSLPNNLPRQATPLIGREKQIADVIAVLRRSDVSLVTLTGPAGTGKTRLSLQVGAQVLEGYRDGVWFVELATLSPDDHKLVPSAIAKALGVREAPGQEVVDTLKDYLKDKEMLLVLDNFEQLTQAAPQVSSLLKAAPHLKMLITSRTPLRVYGEREYQVPPLSLPDRKLLQEHQEYRQERERVRPLDLSSLEQLEEKTRQEFATQRVPGSSTREADRQVDLEQYTQCEAVRLFVDRAQAVKADFEITADNAPDIALICAHLDGLPLAIELAAARIRLFTPQALLGRLSDRLRILTGGARDLPARQQTMRGAIEWSYDLLSEEEKQLFRRMAVFNGGRTLEAIETVCGTDSRQRAVDSGQNARQDDQVTVHRPLPTAHSSLDVLEGVQSLLDKSLLVEREGSNKERRYWMLETLQEYAQEKLWESGEAAALRREHSLYFVKLAEEAEPHLTDKDQQEWLDRLEDEHDNIRAALGWASELAQAGLEVGGEVGGEEGSEEAREAAEVGLRVVAAIWRFWYVRGPYAEGRELLRRAISPWEASEAAVQGRSLRTLTLPGIGSTRRNKAKALHGEGALAYRQGDYSSARSLQEAALDLAREVGDKQTAAYSLSDLGNMATGQGDYPAARALHEESLALRRELGDKWGVAASLGNLGNVAADQGDYSAARALYEESLALQRELGDKYGVAIALSNLGNVATGQGDYPAARALYEESLPLRRELGDNRGIATSLSNLGVVAFLQGDYSAARALHEESLALYRELGDKKGMATSLSNLGSVAADEGDYPAARALHEESLALRRELGDKKGMATSLGNLGNVATGQGDYPAARALHEESLALRRELGDKSGIAASLGNLGNVATGQGDYPAARALHEESLALRRELGDKWGVAIALSNLGTMSADEGDYPAARALHEESLALRRELGDKRGIATSLGNLGNVATGQGDYPAARALYEQSLALRRELGDKKGAAECLAGLGGVAVRLATGRGQGGDVEQVERGAKLLGAAEGLLRTTGAVLDRESHRSYERSVEQASALLGEKTFKRAWDEGHAMSLAEAIENALQPAMAEPDRAQSVQSDEERLERQRQVEEKLHIKIDQDRKARQVEAITGTQYFIELQARARALLLARQEQEVRNDRQIDA